MILQLRINAWREEPSPRIAVLPLLGNPTALAAP